MLSALLRKLGLLGQCTIKCQQQYCHLALLQLHLSINFHIFSTTFFEAHFHVLCPSTNVSYPFTPRVSYGDIKVILTSESVDEILWFDHSNETSSAVLSHGTIYIYHVFYKISLEF